MVKAGKWIKSILIGSKKDKEKRKSTNHPSAVITENSTTPAVIPQTTPKEKKRWSFRRSSATAPGPKESNSNEPTAAKTGHVAPANVESPDSEQKKPEFSAAEIMIHIKAASNANARSIEELSAAIKIQSVFRSYLARKALRALRGLVKLQALARGHLVRKRATATLRCMQALLTAQARARAQRIRCVEEEKLYNNNHRHSTYRINGEDFNFRNSYYEVEKGIMEENVKIVEMDLGELKGSSKTRNNYTYYQNNERRDDRFSTHYASDFDYIKQEYQKISPAPSAITDISPRTFSGHFEDYSFNTAQSSPQCYAESYDYPNYMANTKSSRAKVRSQSAPKQRPDSFERQPSRRRPSVEGRNIPRAVRMQRSSSHVGATAQNYNYPWSIKLDKSMVSLKDSESGSTCSVLTTANYNRSGIPCDHQGNRY